MLERKIHGLNASNYAIVKDGRVVNITRWDAEEFPDWKPAEGEAIVCDDTVAIGHVYDGKTFSDPFPQEHVVIPLVQAKTNRVLEIDKYYMQESASLFVTDEVKERMKKRALEAVESVRAAKTHDEAQAARDAVMVDLITMRAHARSGI